MLSLRAHAFSGASRSCHWTEKGSFHNCCPHLLTRTPLKTVSTRAPGSQGLPASTPHGPGDPLCGTCFATTSCLRSHSPYLMLPAGFPKPLFRWQRSQNYPRCLKQSRAAQLLGSQLRPVCPSTAADSGTVGNEEASLLGGISLTAQVCTCLSEPLSLMTSPCLGCTSALKTEAF